MNRATPQHMPAAGICLFITLLFGSCTSEYYSRIEEGDRLCKEGEYAWAVRAYSAALAIDPRWPLPYSSRAYALQKLGMHQEAIAGYDSALARVSSAELYIARAMARRGFLADTEEQLAQQPADPVLAQLVFALRVSVLSDLNRAVERSPLNADALEKRGEASFDFGLMPEAESDFTTLLLLSPFDAWTYNFRGRVRFERGNLQGALSDYDAAIHWGGNQPWVLYNRGVARQQAEMFGEAIDDFTRVLGADSTDAWAYYRRGLCRLASGDPDSGCADLIQAGVFGHPDSPRVREGLCR